MYLPPDISKHGQTKPKLAPWRWELAWTYFIGTVVERMITPQMLCEHEKLVFVCRYLFALVFRTPEPFFFFLFTHCIQCCQMGNWGQAGRKSSNAFLLLNDMRDSYYTAALLCLHTRGHPRKEIRCAAVTCFLHESHVRMCHSYICPQCKK